MKATANACGLRGDDGGVKGPRVVVMRSDSSVNVWLELLVATTSTF